MPLAWRIGGARVGQKVCLTRLYHKSRELTEYIKAVADKKGNKTGEKGCISNYVSKK